MRFPRLPGALTVLLVLLASVLLPLALVSNWTATTLSDTDEYVATVRPLATDPAVLDAVRDELDAAAARALDRTPAAGQESGQIDEAIRRVTSDDRFEQAWAQGNRQLHQQALAVLEDDDPRVSTRDGMVSIDLSGLLTTLQNRLDAEGLATPVDLSNLDATVPVMKRSDLAQVRGVYHLVESLGFWLPLAWVAIVALVLLTARRRLATLGHLAIGALVTLAMLAMLLIVTRIVATEMSPDQELTEAIWDVVLAPLWTWLWIGAAVAAVVLVARIVAGVLLGRGPSARAR